MFFRVRHLGRGAPRTIGEHVFRFDETLRRWNFDGEAEVQVAMEKHVKPGMTCLDIGANFGLHALLMCKLASGEGHVFCVEPIPANLYLLRRNLKLNGFDSRSTIIESAISDSEAPFIEMRVDSSGLEPSASLSHSNVQGTTAASIKVNNVRLDSLPTLRQRKIDFIKIDVEGAEFKVLQGGAEILKTQKPTLLIEVHSYALPSFDSSAEELESYLVRIGYKIDGFRICRTPTVPIITFWLRPIDASNCFRNIVATGIE